MLYTCSPNYVNTNQYSRFGLTQAIVEHRSFQIDPYVEGLDWSRRNGHYYTNKAPGSSLLGVPAYCLLYVVESALNLDSAGLRDFNLDVTDWFVTAIPSVLLSLFLLKYLLRRYPEAPERAWLAVFTFSLATIMYPFSTTLWGHPTAAACLFFAFYALVVKGNAWATGLFLGLAVLIEYSTVLVIPAYLGYHVWKQRWNSIRGFGQILLAALPSLVLFLWYHKTCFGGWLTMPTVFQNPWFGLQDNQRMFQVLALPDPVVLWKLLFGLERGLFLISPVLLFAVPSFYFLVKSKKHNAEVLVALSIVLVFWAFNSAYVGWRAGHSSGPRYMIPMLPFLALGLARCKPGFSYYWFLGISIINSAAIMSVSTTARPGRSLLTEVIYPSLDASTLLSSFLPILFATGVLFAISKIRDTTPEQSAMRTEDPSAPGVVAASSEGRNMT